MTSNIGEVEIKVEGSNELQSYLQSFNKEIEGGEHSIQILQDEVDEDDVENGTFYVDETGNYYYQATKDSKPIPTNAPDELSEYIEVGTESSNENEVQDEMIESDNEQDIKPLKRHKKEMTVVQANANGEQVSYVLIMDENETEVKDDGDVEEKDDQVYEFEDNEEDNMEKPISTEDTKNILKLIAKTQVSSHFHMCNYCSYTSPKRYLLARHLKCHSEERPHKCSVCERGFKTLSSLQNHINTHTGNKPHRCKFCDSAFTTSGELVRHIRYKHTHEKPHKCNECDYASVELSKLKRHIRCHTGERPYQCPHCTYASPDTFKLKRHLRIHTGEKPYECDICHARFTQSNSLKAHKLIHSVGEKPVFQCELCPTTCGRKTDLRIHVQKLHTSDKPLKCKRCDKSFPDRYSYKVHSKTHEGEKCFKCDLCPYASISARHLESHILIHTDQKPYECTMCDQAFRQKQLLKRHMNLYHTEDYVPPAPKEKTHVCPHCSRSFRHKGNLIRHMAVHDPESGIKEEAFALKVGRQKKIQMIDGQKVEILSEYYDESNEDEEEDEMQAESMDEYQNESIIDEDQKNIVAVKGDNGEQYVVLEVIQMDDNGDGEEGDELQDDMILTDLPADVIHTLKTSKKLQSERAKVSDDKSMDNCFGFDDDDDDEDEIHHKSTIKLIDIHESRIHE